MEPLSSATSILLNYGIAGVVAAIFFWLFWLKDRQLDRERTAFAAAAAAEREAWAKERAGLLKELADETEAHLTDAKSFTTVAIELQRSTSSTVQAQASMFEELKRSMGDRERDRDREMSRPGLPGGRLGPGATR